ncbi:MAG: glycosyltransferase family 2 protein [Bacteroidales bacterium]
MHKISAVIITYNEERYIEQCINSVKDVVDEVVVVDSLSTDRTRDICRKLGVKFIEQEFLGYKEQKNFAIKQAQYNYILSLDADEALSIELRNSILKAKISWKFDGYKCNRLNNYCGQWMYHTSLYPERKLRLFDRRKGQWGGINPHDRFEMDASAKVGSLKGDLLHWVYDTIEEHIAKINHFSTISSKEYYKLGIKAGVGKVAFRPLWRFIHSYIIKAGFLEGYMGFIASLNLAYLCFLKYAKLWKLNRMQKENQKLVDTRVRIANEGWNFSKAGNVLEDNEYLSKDKLRFSYPVSVVITTYNQPEWLRKVLWGFEVQRFNNFEIVIADDGSDSKTKVIISEFVSNSKLSINHVWHPDEGYRKCTILNRAIKAAKGEYLIFTDGDCIPRNDFVETHIRRANKGYFLSGGAVRLPLELSRMVNEEIVKSQVVFERRWLLENGLKMKFRSTKLLRNKCFSAFMNFITTAKATWNGGNASGWKDDFIAVNGFNEDLQYGGQDREFGQRLRNLGLKSKQIRYSATCVHLEHGRPYKTKDSIGRNREIRRMVRRTRSIKTANGIERIA